MRIRKSKPSNLVALAAVLAIASLTVIAIGASGIIPWFSFSVMPGFEGMAAGVEGVQINGQFYANTAGTVLPTGYTWKSTDTRYPILVKNMQPFSSPGELRIETKTPYVRGDPLMSGNTVDYWIKDGSQFVHVTGEIVTYDLPITFAAGETYQGDLTWPDLFSGEKVWFTIGSMTWDEALQEQSPVSGRPSSMGQAWEAPVYAVISEYSVSDGGLHHYVTPRETGREVTLYSSTSQSGTVSELWSYAQSSSLNATLAGSSPLSPDSRMRSSAFICFTIEDFGEEVISAGIGGASCPIVTVVIKLYALRIGEFTYVNPDDTPWAEEQPESTDPVWAWITDPLSSWFANPLNLFGLFVVLGITLIVTVVIFLTFTGAGRAIDAAVGSRNKRGASTVGAALLGIGLVLLASGIAFPAAGLDLPSFASMDDGAAHIALSLRLTNGNPPHVGDTATLGATLYLGTGVVRLSNEQLVFKMDGTTVATLTTDSLGYASTQVFFASAGEHYLRAEWAGNGTLLPAFAELKITAVQPSDPSTPGDATITEQEGYPFLNWLTVIGAGMTIMGGLASALSGKSRARRRGMATAWAVIIITVVLTAAISAAYVAYLSPYFAGWQGYEWLSTFAEVFIVGISAALLTAVIVPALVRSRASRKQKGRR